MSFSSLVRGVDDVTVIDFVGRIVLGSSAGEVRRVVCEVASEDKRKIVLNLALVDYIDSSGLGELISAYARVKQSGGEIRLAHLQKRISDLLQITKLYTVFASYPDEASAVKSFQLL